jgi:hypothetical protein
VDEVKKYTYDITPLNTPFLAKVDGKMTIKGKLAEALRALDFYANRDNYNLNTWPGTPIEKDCGKLARGVLDEIEGIQGNRRKNNAIRVSKRSNSA